MIRRLDKYKAQLVVKGYNQVQGLDYDLLFAPVAQRTSLWASCMLWPLQILKATPLTITLLS
jgi:hypothetical protein